MGIERSLESIGLIDEQTGYQDENESLGSPEMSFRCVKKPALEEKSADLKHHSPGYFL